jgi:glyoxylase-like metal-dependent hydrolase (beta-lactamase superfamily II)
MKTWTTKSGYRVIRVLAGRSNVFLLTFGGKNILIDTGPSYLWKWLKRRLDRLGIKHLDALILTHAHMDHAENAHRIRDTYQAPVYIHRREAAYLAAGENIIPQGTTMITQALTHLLSRKIAPFLRYTACEPDVRTGDRFSLQDLGFNAYILHTPGHTSGSVSIIVDDEIALVGDCMFGVLRGSVFPPFANDTGQMVRSWGKLLETGCSLFLPSHGSANSRQLVQREYEKRAGNRPA